MNQDICEKIINTFIKSKTLKEEIQKTNWHFSDLDLLALVNNCADNYNQRLEFMELIEENTEKVKIKEMAIDIINYQKKVFEEFIKPVDNSIYHVVIKEKPQVVHKEHYIVKTYEVALNVIKSYIEYYNIRNVDSRFDIIKRVLIVPQKPEDIENGEIGSCTFRNGLNLIDVYINDMFGINKNEIRLKNHLIKYPSFLLAGDLVSYYADWDEYHSTGGTVKGNKKMYGIIVFDMYEKYKYDACIQLLDSPYVKERRIEEIDELGRYQDFLWHEHVGYTFIEKENIDTVPDNIREDYNYLLPALKKMWS